MQSLIPKSPAPQPKPHTVPVFTQPTPKRRLERTMGKVKQVALVVLAAVVALVGFYIAIRIAVSLMQGYSWHEMDWHDRGSTSIGDFFAASEIGKREISREGKKCFEYFSYKDGLPIKVICSK